MTCRQACGARVPGARRARFGSARSTASSCAAPARPSIAPICATSGWPLPFARWVDACSARRPWTASGACAAPIAARRRAVPADRVPWWIIRWTFPEFYRRTWLSRRRRDADAFFFQNKINKQTKNRKPRFCRRLSSLFPKKNQRILFFITPFFRNRASVFLSLGKKKGGPLHFEHRRIRESFFFLSKLCAHRTSDRRFCLPLGPERGIASLLESRGFFFVFCSLRHRKGVEKERSPGVTS